MNFFEKKEIPTLEYLIVLAMVMAIVIAGLTTKVVPKSRQTGTQFFYRVIQNIMDPPPQDAFGLDLSD